MRKTSASAIAALVFSVIALVPVAVVLGITALFRIRDRGLRGRRVAISALALSGVWTAAVMVAVIGGAGWQSRHHVALESLHVGQCFQAPTDPNNDYTPVSCAKTHDGEIVARPSLGGGRYPDSGTLYARAWQSCADAAGTKVLYLDGPTATDTLEVAVPSEDGWNQDHMHQAVCAVGSLVHRTEPDVPRPVGDALDTARFTAVQRTGLALVSRSAAVRELLSVHADPDHPAQVRALAQQLAEDDRSEAAALTRWAASGAPTPAIADAARSMAEAERNEVADANRLASPTTGAGTWKDSLDGFGLATLNEGGAFRRALGLPY